MRKHSRNSSGGIVPVNGEPMWNHSHLRFSIGTAMINNGDLPPRVIDQRMTDHGYPTKTGQWLRIMKDAVITKHMIDTLTSVFGCPRTDMISDAEYARLELCRNPRCEH